MKPVEEIGLLKMDFLGLRNLDVIEDAVDIIERSRGDELDIDAIPLDDAQDLRDARRAATRSASSSSSPRACATRCGRSKPTEFDDLSRSSRSTGPGAMAVHPDLRARQEGPESVTLPRRAPARDHRADLRLTASTRSS